MAVPFNEQVPHSIPVHTHINIHMHSCVYASCLCKNTSLSLQCDVYNVTYTSPERNSWIRVAFNEQVPRQIYIHINLHMYICI